MWGEISTTKNPTDSPVAWGARAIKEQGGFGLLHDRQEWRYRNAKGEEYDSCAELPPPKAYRPFSIWLIGKALKAARKWATTQDPSSYDMFEFRDEKRGYELRATCNGSYGYVYLTAWVKNEEANDRMIAASPRMFKALVDLFEHCSMVHKYWGENSNQKEADAAIAEGLAIIAEIKGEKS